MKLLVTGGAGYVGSHAVRHLVELGHDVWVYDNLSRGHSQAVPHGRLIEADLLDTGALSHALASKHIEAVLHFAAFALVGESVQQPAAYWDNNVAGSLSLLEAMRSQNVRKIVFSSSTATYGNASKMPITERTPQLPINPYGQTKLAVERMLDDFARAYGFRYAALRYFNAAGASSDGRLGEDHDPETHLIPLVLQAALGQRPSVTILGDDYPTPDGTCIRDYVHVEDLARAHALALDRLDRLPSMCLNLGTGFGCSVREVINAARRASGREIRFEIGPRRPGDPAELVADASLARDVLGWQPRYLDIEEIVATAWRWHWSHPGGFSAARLSA